MTTSTKTTTSTTNVAAAAWIKRSAGPENTDIRPFRSHFSDAELDDLRRRIASTRWPDRETVADSSQGVRLATIQQLARYWATEYDWRKCEAKLNALPQFLTEIDGLDIHFVHVRSKHPNALPMIVTHGWPGSVVEQLKIIGPLTDPTAYGGTAADAFDVVIPSLPGYGFSGKPTATGWDPPRIARAWTVLMKRVGYERFVAQGGDWGALVTEQMGAQAPPELIGIHINLPSAVPAEIAHALPSHVAPPDLAVDERHAFERLDFFLSRGLAYAQEMASSPQTLGYSLADSPVGLAAWFFEKFAAWTDSGGEPERALSCDDMLDDITFTWLTNTGPSGARLYWENKLPFFAPVGIAIPVAVSVFPAEIYRAPRTWVERAYPKLIHYNQVDKGGHFAAWEQPQLLTIELRTGFRSLR
jgi:pimeloyl-ACP methyl ester carboxylesterase